MEDLIEKIDKRKFNGGPRVGAGKKQGSKNRKTLIKEAAQMYLIRRVEEEIEGLTTALLDKAKEQDVGAIKEAFDRAWGKSREKHDVNFRAIVEISKEVADKYDVPHNDTSKGSKG